MKRKGSAIILFVLISAAIMISSISLIHKSLLQSMMSIANQDKIQAYYLVETKLNRFLYSENNRENLLIPTIETYLKSPLIKSEFTLNLMESDVEEEDKIKTIRLEFRNKDNRKCIHIISEVDYKGFKNRKLIQKTYINSIFENGTLPLISYDLDFHTCVNLDKFYENIKELDMKKIPADFVKINTFDKYEVQIEARNSSYDKIRTISSSYVDEKEYYKVQPYKIFLNMENKLNTPISLRIIDNPSYNPVSLKGVIIIDGDLIIQKRFDFNGIIILRGKDSKIIVENEVLDYKPTIKGIIITEGKTDFIDKIKLTYNWDYIGQFGLYLPGFIDMQDE